MKFANALRFLPFFLLFGSSWAFARPEKIYGYLVKETGIIFYVDDGSKSSFEVIKKGESPIKLELNRIDFSYDDMYFKEALSIEYTWKELGIDNSANIQVVNPFEERHGKSWCRGEF